MTARDKSDTRHTHFEPGSRKTKLSLGPKLQEMEESNQPITNNRPRFQTLPPLQNNQIGELLLSLKILNILFLGLGKASV